MSPQAANRRSHLLYFVLAAFDVLTVCAALYFSHALMDIYVGSVAVNQAWAERVATFSRLGQLAAAANAPGNDVFLTGDADIELKRMASAAAAFRSQFAEARRTLAAELSPTEAEPLLDRLDAVARAMSAMTEQARLTFVDFQDHRPVAASARMASMDRRYAEVNRALTDLRESVAMKQRMDFKRQLDAAAQLAKYLYAVGALVLLMVCGATFYGHRSARQAQLDAAERERQSRELQVANHRLEGAAHRNRLAAEALQQANDQLQSRFKRFLELQDRQQQHIARELHEEVSQTLASLKLRLSATPALDAAGSLAEDAIGRLRHLTHNLTPHGMETVGLASALATHLREWTHGARLRVQYADKLRTRPAFRIEHAAYRVAQEAVANAVRHANARRLRVELSGTASEVRLSVMDDGSGFDVETARRRATLGIALMEQRTAMVGGCLEIRSAPGEGTAVMARFPLHQQADWLK